MRQRGSEVLEVIREQPPVAELRHGGRIDGEQEVEPVGPSR